MIKEDSVVGVGAPTNSVAADSVSGLTGSPPVSKQAQKKRYGKTRSPILFPDMMKRTVPNLVKEARDKRSLKRDEPITIMKIGRAHV